MPQTVIGCDLTRDWIDAHVLPSGQASRVENSLAGIERWVATLAPQTLVVFEATRGCDGQLITALSARRLRFARVNARRAHDLARALGVSAEAGRVDARVLAEMGQKVAAAASRSVRFHRADGFPAAAQAFDRHDQARGDPPPYHRSGRVAERDRGNTPPCPPASAGRPRH